MILAKSAGFCWGVQRAVEKARSIAMTGKGIVRTDGPLIHNRQMMETLASEDIREWDRNPPDDSTTLLVRAHGIPPARRKDLSDLHCNVEDATCPDVARIQGLIRKHARAGYHILIFGDPGHAEVVGLEGYAEEKGHVVSRPDDIAALSVPEPVCLVSQSTQLPCSYEAVVAETRRRFTNVKVLDTICQSTRNRQQELVEIAGQVEVIVVVGGVHSANTLRLVELASRYRPTCHIETADKLDPDFFRPYRVAGLTAGASTPGFVIDAVKKALDAI